MADSNHRQRGGQPEDDVVDRDIGRAADEDLFRRGRRLVGRWWSNQLKDNLQQCLCLAGSRRPVD